MLDSANIPKIGQVYFRHQDCRIVLDVTETQVFYEELFEEFFGTTIEYDRTKYQKQISIKAWKLWARIATIV